MTSLTEKRTVLQRKKVQREGTIDRLEKSLEKTRSLLAEISRKRPQKRNAKVILHKNKDRLEILEFQEKQELRKAKAEIALIETEIKENQKQETKYHKIRVGAGVFLGLMVLFSIFTVLFSGSDSSLTGLLVGENLTTENISVEDGLETSPSENITPPLELEVGVEENLSDHNSPDLALPETEVPEIALNETETSTAPEIIKSPETITAAIPSEIVLPPTAMEILPEGGMVVTKRKAIRVGQPVQWTKEVSLEKAEKVTVEIPAEADDIKITKDNSPENGFPEKGSNFLTGGAIVETDSFSFHAFFTKIWDWLTGGITGGVVVEEDGVKEIVLDGTSTDYVVEFTTEAPQAVEEIIPKGKEVTISAPDELGYTDVIAFTTLDDTIPMTNQEHWKVIWHNYESVDVKVKKVSEVAEQATVLTETISENSGVKKSEYVRQEVPFVAYDDDKDGFIDSIEWVVPHLSKQTYEIIEVIQAEHLDSNRKFISDIYKDVRRLDDKWSETIPADDYVRVVFEKNLTSDKDITIYPRVISGNPRVEVFEKDKNEKILEFLPPLDEEYHQLLLTDFSGNQDTFDLLIKDGSVQFDHIIDPVNPRTFFVGNTTTVMCGDFNEGYKSMVVWPNATIHICPVIITSNQTGYVNITLNAGANGVFHLYGPGGLINGSGAVAGGEGTAGTTPTTATGGTDGEVYLIGNTSSFLRNRGGGGGALRFDGATASGGGGGAFGDKGGNGSRSTASATNKQGEAGKSYGGTRSEILELGSGGGGGSGDLVRQGGHGGGGIRINVGGGGTIFVNGTFNFNGTQGQFGVGSGTDEGDGGGGSGGHIILDGGFINVTYANFFADGGAGGNAAESSEACGGGGGSGGRILFIYNTLQNFSTNVSVRNGTAGITTLASCAVNSTAGYAGTSAYNFSGSGSQGISSNFTDFTAPNITLITPADGSSWNQNDVINISAFVFDVNSIFNVSINITLPDGSFDSKGFHTPAQNINNNYTVAYTLSQAGTYLVTFFANDSLGNINGSIIGLFGIQNRTAVNISFTVASADITPPNVTNITPVLKVDQDIYPRVNWSMFIELGVNVTDSSSITLVYANVSYPNFSTITYPLSSNTGTNWYNISFYVPDLKGKYNFTIIANDSANNINNTQFSNFTAFVNCGNITNTTAMDQDVTSASHCFDMGKNHTILNCAGFTINYGSQATGFAVASNVTKNVTVQNCIIQKRGITGSSNYGVYFDRVYNGSIFNNTIFTGGTTTNYGVYVDDNIGTYIENNTVRTSGSSTTNHVILVEANAATINTNITIRKNYLVVNGTGADAGILVQSGANQNVINNNTILANSSGTGNGGILINTARNIMLWNTMIVNGTGTARGISMVTSGDNNWIQNNTIQLISTGSADNGLRFNGATNNTIQGNIILVGGTTGGVGVVFTGSANTNLLENNSIITNGSSSANYGIQSSTSTHQSIKNNNIVTGGTSTNYGIVLDTIASHCVLTTNTILTNGSSTDNYGIYVTQSGNTTITYNTVRTNGSTANVGLLITAGSNNTYAAENIIQSSGASLTPNENYGVYLSDQVTNTTLVNNNITSLSSDFIIYDLTLDDMINYLIYNNTWGEIRWIDNGSSSTGSFVRNLTLNITNNLGLGLDRNLFIANNTLAFNTSAFGLGIGGRGRANGTVNMTVIGINNTYVTEIAMLHNYNLSINFSIVQSGGVKCLTCSNISYIGNTLKFNATGLGVFSANDTPVAPPIRPSVTNITPILNSRFNITNLIEIGVNVSDDEGISFVLANITYPNQSTILFNLSNNAARPNWYNMSFRIPELTGLYNVSIVANDTTNLYNRTQFSNFTVSVGCANITRTTTMDQNVVSGGTCFYIGAANVDLNCTGYTITYGTQQAGNGVNNTDGYSHLTVKHCRMIKGSIISSDNMGINLDSLSNSPVSNITLINNTIITNGTSSNYGIRFQANIVNSRAENNTIVTDGSLGDNIGMFMNFQSSNNSLINNTIRTNGRSTGNYGVLIQSASHNNSFVSNTIRTNGTAANNYGIWLNSEINKTLIFANDIYTNGTTTNLGIYVLQACYDTKIYSNTISTDGTGSSSHGIALQQSFNNSVINNTIIFNGTSGVYGIKLEGGTNNTLIDNNILTFRIGSGSHGIQIESESASNILVNNNITVSVDTGSFVINDETNTNILNYLVYNNTFGEIRWMDNGTGSFLRNLTVETTSSAGLGLHRNLFIGDNVAALNTSAFTVGRGRINGTANITLSGLSLTAVAEIRKVHSYNTSGAEVRSTGTDCLIPSGSCFNLGYAGGILKFNTSSFSSFSASETSTCGNLTVSTTLSNSVSSTGTCFQIRAANIVLDCAGYTVTYGTAEQGIGVNNSGSLADGFSAGYDHVTIKNCVIEKGSTLGNFNYGIALVAALNNTLAYNTIVTNGVTDNDGIFIRTSSDLNRIYNNTIFTNGTVKNRGINFDTSSSFNVVENNSIYTNGTDTVSNTDSNGIRLASSSHSNRISFNTVYTNGSEDSNNGISVSGSNNNTIEGNRVFTRGVSSNVGIRLDGALNTTVRDNIVFTTGSGSTSYALEITNGANDSRIENNNLTVQGFTSSARGIVIETDSTRNFFINNNITTSDDEVILDRTPDDMVNYLIYNNSFGEIRWLDNGSNSFQRNLTIDTTLNTLRYSHEIFIGNNTFYLNMTGISLLSGLTSRINSSANISFYNTNYTNFTNIMRLHNYTSDSVFIRSNGINCTWPNCFPIKNDSTSNSFYFNVTHAGGSYSVNGTRPFTGGAANTAPTVPTPHIPLNGSTTTNRTGTFAWFNSTDADGDMISYELVIDDNPRFNNPEVNVSAILSAFGNESGASYYFNTVLLAVDTTYYWRVRANDSSGSNGKYSDWSNNPTGAAGEGRNLSNFTLSSLLQVSLRTSAVEFGTLSQDQVESTADQSPPPLRAENTGNIYFNITFNGTRYFSSVDFPSSYYNFKVRENETGSFNLSQSQLMWVFMPLVNNSVGFKEFHVAELNWRDAFNDVLVDINVTIPNDEPAGDKSSNITFAITSSNLG